MILRKKNRTRFRCHKINAYSKSSLALYPQSYRYELKVEKFTGFMLLVHVFPPNFPNLHLNFPIFSQSFFLLSGFVPHRQIFASGRNPFSPYAMFSFSKGFSLEQYNAPFHETENLVIIGWVLRSVACVPREPIISNTLTHFSDKSVHRSSKKSIYELRNLIYGDNSSIVQSIIN
jgi:hypothetical protein